MRDEDRTERERPVCSKAASHIAAGPASDTAPTGHKAVSHFPPLGEISHSHVRPVLSDPETRFYQTQSIASGKSGFQDQTTVS